MGKREKRSDIISSGVVIPVVLVVEVFGPFCINNKCSTCSPAVPFVRNQLPCFYLLSHKSVNNTYECLLKLVGIPTGVEESFFFAIVQSCKFSFW